LLTEQKTTKIIQLLEELRRDLPNVRDRLDPETEVLQHPTNPQQVVTTMEHRREADERTKHKR
ncbi:MAG: hypothetical protein LH481_02125, partial [Burkholderiales bacterium]|nr:hypothetical protein [Burkholderiales bacterium]